MYAASPVVVWAANLSFSSVNFIGPRTEPFLWGQLMALYEGLSLLEEMNYHFFLFLFISSIRKLSFWMAHLHLDDTLFLRSMFVNNPVNFQWNKITYDIRSCYHFRSSPNACLDLHETTCVAFWPLAALSLPWYSDVLSLSSTVPCPSHDPRTEIPWLSTLVFPYSTNWTITRTGLRDRETKPKTILKFSIQIEGRRIERWPRTRQRIMLTSMLNSSTWNQDCADWEDGEGVLAVERGFNGRGHHPRRNEGPAAADGDVQG